MYSLLCFVLFSIQTSFLRNLSLFMSQNRYMSSEDQSCPQNKTQKRNSCARCLIPDILSHLRPNQVGPAPPFFELSLRRFPSKNVFQGPRDDESKNGGCWEKQPLTSLLSLVLLPNLFHVLGKEPHRLALPVPELERSPQELLCIPSLSPLDTSRGNSIDRL